MTKICEICCNPLTGLQTKYCSRACHNKSGNFKHQCYVSQQKRATERKLHLIRLKGGSCELCGYSRNIAALCFHHKDPSLKHKKLDSRSISNGRMVDLIDELAKCQLLCHNCHMEVHYPTLVLDTLAKSFALTN